MSLPDRIFILEENSAKVDVFACGEGRIAVHCGTLVDEHSARQLKNALMAVLSGEFDRAMSESDLRFDLSRRPVRTSSQASPSSAIRPNLEQL
jgi:hypothetical protein